MKQGYYILVQTDEENVWEMYTGPGMPGSRPTCYPSIEAVHVAVQEDQENTGDEWVSDHWTIFHLDGFVAHTFGIQ